MGIGAGVFLIALGAILAFAVDYDPAGVRLDAVGWILMAAGGLALLMELLVFGPRRRSRGVVTERRAYDDEPPPP
jgi:hypothetical protein